MATTIDEVEVLELVRELLKDAGVEDEIAAETQFADLEIDSLDAAELLTTLKARYGVDIARTAVFDASVGDLVRVVVNSSTT